MPCRRTLVNARRQGTHFRHLIGDFLPHQMSSQTDFTALPYEKFTSIGKAKMMRIESVTGLNTLVEPLGGISPLVRNHAAFTRTSRCSCHRCSASQRSFCFITQSTKTHAGYVDRNIQFQRTFGIWTYYRFGQTFLAVAFNHEACQRSRKKSQVIPGWNVFEQGHSAHPVTSQLCFDVYVIDYLGFKNEALTEERFISWHCISLHEN